MNRRNFMASCGAVAGAAAFFESMAAVGAVPGDKPFAKAKLRMSAPLDWFPGSSPAEKVKSASEWGLPAYEWLGASGDQEAMRKVADECGMELSCTGGCGRIGPGTMVKKEDHDEVVKQFKERVAFAKKVNCKHLVGLSGNTRDDASYDEQMDNVLACLKRLAPIAEENQVFLVMEALNPLVDHKGYFLTRTDQAMTLLKEVNSPNVKMLFDIYHQQITEGNVIRNLTSNIERIGHFHVADNPGRKEPGTGELDYKNIFKALAGTGYRDFVALECGHSTKNYEDTLKATLACLDF